MTINEHLHQTIEALEDENARLVGRVTDLEYMNEELEVFGEYGKEICKKALETFGAESQITMMFEEMAELQKELCKNRRGAYNKIAISEEIADVAIMLNQMCILFDCGDLVKIYIDEKLERLESRMKGSANNV